MSKTEESRGPGRPEFEVTAAMRDQVSIAAGGGMSHEEIAIGLGIARGTLEKHFEAELAQGAYARRLEVLEAMHRAALKGNVAAQKAYLALDPKPAVPPAPEETAPRSEKLGKKEQADRDARTAQMGNEWQDLLPASPSLQ